MCMQGALYSHTICVPWYFLCIHEIRTTVHHRQPRMHVQLEPVVSLMDSRRDEALLVVVGDEVRTTTG